jgi:hypothetical protein
MTIGKTASPRAGRSLEGLVAPLREHVLAAVRIAREIGLDSEWLEKASQRDNIRTDSQDRAAWAAVAITLVDMIRTGLPADGSRAGAWFGADDFRKWSAFGRALQPLAGEPNLLELFPYLLDTYGRTTRLDVMRDVSLSASRAARKKVGSFYTPADLADFMVAAIADPAGVETQEWWFDPAVGSGVFLAAALRRYQAPDRVNFAESRLAGCDISPQACDFAAFTLLAEVAADVVSPMTSWIAIRSNFVAVDAVSAASGGELRDRLSPGAGPLRLICNPPYATGKAVSMADGHPTKSLYLPFVEMSWTVASQPDDAAALVVPLSLGANRSADHRRCRSAMRGHGGEWTLLFFDRQPHALFGEGAKTRATIAIRRPGPTPASIRTSRLLKWTSRQRSTIFTEARTAEMGQASTARLIPKLGSREEVDLYRSLEPYRLRSGARPEPSKAAASEIVGNAMSADVFVAGTAYNFLNVFRNYPDQLSWRGTLSASGINRLRCASLEEADLVTAVLSSRMAYWLWHVECDGFHVPAWFLKELPLLNIPMPKEVEEQLACLGRSAWEGLQRDVICSTNRERLTFAFRPTAISDVRGKIDTLLAELVGAEQGTAAMLSDFEQQVVSIDGSVRLAGNRANKGNKNEA